MAEVVKAKKGYSIRSLLVIMTLLAVWMAIPRTPESRHLAFKHQLFFIFHQVPLWSLLGLTLWLLTGRRTIVLLSAATLILLIWMPIILIAAETACTGVPLNTQCERFLRAVGLMENYRIIYKTIFRGFGYGPPH